jgi:hypothetical protein
MRPLSSSVNAEIPYDTGESVARPMMIPVSGTDGRAFQNSRSGTALAGIKKALFVSGLRRLLQSTKQQTKSLLTSMSLLSLGLKLNGRSKQPCGEWTFNDVREDESHNGELPRLTASWFAMAKLVVLTGFDIGSLFSVQSSFPLRKNVLKSARILSFKRITLHLHHAPIITKQLEMLCMTFHAFCGRS